MPRGGGRSYVDDEDDNYYLDDYYEDYGDDDDDEDEGPVKGRPTPGSPKTGTAKGSTINVVKAGAGQCASSKTPSNAAAAGNKAAAAKVQNSGTFSLIPPAEDVARFAFDTPSPDDAVLRAQGRGTGPRPVPPPAAAPKGTPHRQATTKAPGPGAKPRPAAGGTAGGKPAGQHGPGPPTAQPATPETGDDAVQQATQGMRRLEVDHSSGAVGPSSAGDIDTSVGGRSQSNNNGPAAAGLSSGKAKLHMVVVGHVDAGKSTLMGRLLHDVGEVSGKTVHKQQREAAQAGKASFSWAWLLDERAEERARGVTVDLAYARFQTPHRSVTLLDAPGHRDFVPNMIAGAGQADCAILVVDGSPGGFEAGFEGSGTGPGGQTREHAQLVRSLGVAQLIVAVTKLDTCGFAEDRFEEIKAVLGPFLRQCGFSSSSVRWLPVVGPTGQNLVEAPTEAALARWWKGPTLLEAIDAFKPPPRETARPLRLVVSDVVGPGKGGAVLAGKLEAGTLRVGDKVLVVPSAQQGTVRTISVDGHTASEACAGDSAEVAVHGIDPVALAAGAVLCPPSTPVPQPTHIQARVLVLDTPTPILKGQPVTVHAHAARESGHISALGSLLDPRTGEVAKARPRALTKGQTAIVELTLARSIPLELYADLRALGRVALREKGRTLAVGIVTALLE